MPAGEIERFVVDQIRAIGQDPALVAWPEIGDALTAIGPPVTPEAAQAALAPFDATWDAMPVADQCRLLSLLIERVTYDGETVALTFRQNGFTDAIHEQATDD